MNLSIEQEVSGIDPEVIEQDLNDQALGSEVAEFGIGDLFSKIADLFRVETGAGDISDYIDLPMNFDHSEGLAQILRGASGFIGANFLRSAILDLVVGFWRWTGKGEA